MRPTRMGWSAAALSALTLFAASSTGNNLLYLLLSVTVAALVLAAFAGRRELAGVSVRATAPSQAFRGTPTALDFELTAALGRPARWLRLAGPDGTTDAGSLPPGGSARATLRVVPVRRGRVLCGGLYIETLYPFGLFTTRRRLPPFEILALPQASPFSPQAPLESDPRAVGAGARGKSRDGEFWGPRPYAPDDDARLIHWKLTAKTGRPVVVEHAAAPLGQAIVRLEGSDDAAVERAASACRWHIDAGTETGLVGPGVEVAPARGLEQLDRLLRALAVVGEGGTAHPLAPAPAPRDPGPSDSPLLRRLGLLGIAFVYGALFLIDEVEPAWLLAGAPLLPLGLLLHERGGPFPPARLWSGVSFVALLYLVLLDWRRSGVAMANVHLLGYLLINRLLNPWSRGELRQVFLIIYLAFFLVSGLTISPWYFPLFIAWTALAGAWLMLQSGADAAAPRAWTPSLARLLVAGAALGAFVFASAPRVEGWRRFNPFVASGIDKLQVRSSSVMGFTERVALGHFGTIRKSSARVLRVAPAVPPPPGTLPPAIKVRGSAFDRFDGIAWTKDPMDFRYRARGRNFKTTAGRAWAARTGDALTFPVPAPASGTGADYEMTVYPMQVSVLFAPGGLWHADGIAEAAWTDHTGSVYMASNYMTGAKYTARVLPPGSLPTDGALDLAERARRAALITPAGTDGRVAALAAEWTKGLQDPEAKVRAVTARLRRGYSYSTYSDGRGTGLPGFLFETKSGNCEYFATAAAILLRHAGVPTRLVSGFSVDEWNQYGRFYDVRQSDAHAWIEAEIPGKGWLAFDPTPPVSGLELSADAIMRRLERWAEAAQASWYRNIIGYDQLSQRNTFLRWGFGRTMEDLRRALERLLRGGLALAFAAGLLSWAARELARLVFRRGDAYERAEVALARAGLRRRPSQTPREFAAEVVGARPELDDLSALAEAHYERRYAGRAPDASARGEQLKRLRRLKSRI